MSQNYFIADLHLSHQNLAAHRGFDDMMEHDVQIVQALRDVPKDKSGWRDRLAYKITSFTMKHIASPEYAAFIKVCSWRGHDVLVDEALGWHRDRGD